MHPESREEFRGFGAETLCFCLKSPSLCARWISPEVPQGDIGDGRVAWAFGQASRKT